MGEEARAKGPKVQCCDASEDFNGALTGSRSPNAA